MPAASSASDESPRYVLPGEREESNEWLVLSSIVGEPAGAVAVYGVRSGRAGTRGNLDGAEHRRGSSARGDACGLGVGPIPGAGREQYRSVGREQRWYLESDNRRASRG